jgi:hypothetical protein
MRFRKTDRDAGDRHFRNAFRTPTSDDGHMMADRPERFGPSERDRGKKSAASYLLTAALIAVGIGVVALVTKVLPLSSSIGVATEILAFAVVFIPSARLIQRAADRKFNRTH